MMQQASKGWEPRREKKQQYSELLIEGSSAPTTLSGRQPSRCAGCESGGAVRLGCQNLCLTFSRGYSWVNWFSSLNARETSNFHAL